MTTDNLITYADFQKVEIRAGRIVECRPFPEAHKPACRLLIDFGPGTGIKRSSAQITEHYRPGDLEGKMIMAVVNFPPKQIGPFISEVLVLGFPDQNEKVILAVPDKPGIEPGARLF